MSQIEIYKQRSDAIKDIGKDLSKQVLEYKGLTLLALTNVLLNMMALGAAFGVSYETLLLFTRWVQSHGGLVIAPNWDNVLLSVMTVLLWFLGRTYIMVLMYNTIDKRYGFTYTQLLKMYLQKFALIIPSIVLAIIITYLLPAAIYIAFIIIAIWIGVLSYYQIDAIYKRSYIKALKNPRHLMTFKLFFWYEVLNVITYGITSIYTKPRKMVYQYNATIKKNEQKINHITQKQA